ncbi:MAG: MGH1-like glycoside hydrolase domain-containing protein [Novosphingobium sp.]
MADTSFGSTESAPAEGRPGQARFFKRYDTIDIADLLQAGTNAIAVLVHCYGVDAAFHEAVRGMWQPTFGEGGLWVRGSAGSERLDSSEQWRCIQSHAWEPLELRCNNGLGFLESLDANRLPHGWTEPGFDDSTWDQAQPMISGGGGPESFFGGIETRPFPTLLPRGIPQLAEADLCPARVVSVHGLVPDPSLPIEQRSYVEPLCEPGGLVVESVPQPGSELSVTTAPDRDLMILFDMGKIMTGCPYVVLESEAGGELIELAVSEKLPGEWDEGGPSPDARITPDPHIGLDVHLARYRTTAGQQRFEAFEWSAVRWLQLAIRDAPVGLIVREVGVRTQYYPVEKRGSFRCSDAVLTRLWDVGAYTLRQCMHDAWEDCPGREQRQWLGDATVENLVAIAAFGDDAAPLNAKYLRQAAESQRPDGLTQMFAPGDHRHDGILIPDWTLQWILNAGDHLEHFGDLECIEEIFPSIARALAWFERHTGPSGLVADMPYWHFMDWAGLGRHGEAAALNAQFAGSLRAAARMAAALSWDQKADEWNARADSIIAAIDRRHWDEARGIWVDVVNPVTGEQEPRCSQHTVAAMALWGKPAPDRLSRALERATDPARLTFTAAPPIVPTGETLDEQEGVVLANTFYAHFMYEALAKHGLLHRSLDQMRARFGPMLARGATTLWESYEPTASLCHGFSASPTWQMSRHILGVHPLDPGYAAIGVALDLADLDWAEGTFATPHGDIRVRLDRSADGFVAQIDNGTEFALAVLPNANGHCPLKTSIAAGEMASIEYRRG